MKNKIKLTALTVLTSLLFNATGAYAADSPFKIEAFGMDTIAGFEAPIYSSQTLPNKEVTFSILKPSGSELKIPVITSDEGVAEFNLYDYHTKQAGEYKVAAKLGDSAYSNYNSFTVFADSMSIHNSTLNASKLLAYANNKDKVYVTITLKDKNNNLIEGHEVVVIPSRPDDEIVKISKQQFTNAEGSIIYAISSGKRGVSVYSFLDATTNKIINERLEIAYTGLDNAGGDYDTAYAAAGEVSTLEFEDLPTTIEPNSDVRFTLRALDSDENTVNNYQGTVHFSVEGSNSVYADVPNDYTFDIDFDSGSHDFEDAGASLNFLQPGNYTVVATDLDDFTVRGEIDIFVGPGSSDVVEPPSDFELVITSPTPGTYSTNTITIAGTAPSTNLTIQFFDNDSSIGETEVDNDRTFSYQTSELIDGTHTLLAVGLDSGDTIQYTSEEITFNVDLAAPQVEDIQISPSDGVQADQIIEVTVISEENVYQGAIVFGVDIAELEQDPTNLTKYTASIQAPSEPGIYAIDVILVDELGNEGSYPDALSVQVGDAAPVEEPDEEPIVEEDLPPTDVFGLQSEPSDSKVSLTWQKATDDSNIANYKIYFGLNPANLTQVVNTADNKNTWYIPNLNNGNEYFFSVAAVDDAGQESLNQSSIVGGVPFAQIKLFIPKEEPKVLTQSLETDKLESTGPEMIWFLVASILIAQLYFKFQKKVC